MDELQKKIEDLLEKLRQECDADTFNEVNCLLQALIARIAFLKKFGKDSYIHYGIYDNDYDDEDDND